MTTTAKRDLFTLNTPQDVERIRVWFRYRKGVIRWKNLEIGSNRSDSVTPAELPDGRDAMLHGKPHWSYGEPRLASPDEFEIRERTKLEVPEEFLGPKCQHCEGTGRRTLQHLATVRKETLEELQSKVASGEVHITGVDQETQTFNCTYCGGTSYESRKIVKAQIKRGCFGDIVLRGAKKPEKICKALSRLTGKEVVYDYEYIGNGEAELSFYHETISPFTVGE